MNIDLPGDSGDYHLLTEGVELSKHTVGMTCEIGLRRGGGTKVIIDAIAVHCPGKVHIAIDPYGRIPYEHKQDQPVRLDYTNEMLADCMTNVYRYAQERKVHFIFFNLEDTEFFKRYFDGVPVYELEKRIETKYSFVHFDGPHSVEPLMEEINFFTCFTPPGACWVFDDVVGYYDHDKIEAHLFAHGFKLIRKTHHKALYQKI